MSVIPFPRPEPLVWVCNCGCQTFRLYSDDTAECASCGSRGAGLWGKQLPPAPEIAPEAPRVASPVVVHFPTKQVALNSLLDSCTVAMACAVVVVARDGDYGHWLDFETEQERLHAIASLQFSIERIEQIRVPN